MILDSEQQEAVDSLDGPILCVAGAGSGKTTVIVERYRNILQHGVPPERTLTLTFTAQAAKEMADRAGYTSKPVFRTFHSFALELLKTERDLLPFTLTPEIIPMPNDVYETMIQLLRTYQVIPNYKTLAEGISIFKRRGLTPEQAMVDGASSGVSYMIAAAYRDYEKICRQKGWLDFDSIMWEAVNLLEANEAVRSRNQFEYVQVDEAQDTDKKQIDLIRLVSKENMFAVGDNNQLIYEWRSALPGIFKQFVPYFPNLKTIFLGTNYRSSKKLVSFFKQILPVDDGLASHTRPSEMSPEGLAPTITQYKNDEEEAIRVLSLVTDPDNTAIIARTNRQLEEFRYQCLKKGMLFRFFGKSSFWDQGEVKKLVQLVRENKGRLRSFKAHNAVETVLAQHNLAARYKTQWKFGDSDPEENLRKVHQIAQRFEKVDEFLAFVAKASHSNRNKTGVILSTVHKMKGKEANHVFLVGVNQGVLPHQKGELSEEKRIFYVGASRAARFLHISYFDNPSMFLLPFMEKAEPAVDLPGVQKTLF